MNLQNITLIFIALYVFFMLSSALHFFRVVCKNEGGVAWIKFVWKMIASIKRKDDNEIISLDKNSDGNIPREKKLEVNPHPLKSSSDVGNESYS